MHIYSRYQIYLTEYPLETALETHHPSSKRHGKRLRIAGNIRRGRGGSQLRGRGRLHAQSADDGVSLVAGAVHLCVHRAVRGREAIGAEDSVMTAGGSEHACAVGFSWDEGWCVEGC